MPSLHFVQAPGMQVKLMLDGRHFRDAKGIELMKAVIFDMDGVLVDSEPLHYKTDILILESFGITVEPSYLDKFVGMTNPEMWRIICNEYDLKVEINEILNKQLSLKLKL